MNDSPSGTPAYQPNPQNEHLFLNILCNIVLPVWVLNRGNVYLGPVASLIVALAFPLSFGFFELFKKKKFNMVSVLGVINVGVTGGFALSGLDGIWFAVKDAAFPFLIGLFVFGSAFTKSPFIRSMILNPNVVKMDLLQTKLTELNKEELFNSHLRRATMALSGSFFLSAALNFFLARRIFVPMDSGLTSEQKAVVLNEQIGQMTSTSMVVIVVPSIIFVLVLFWFLFNGIKKMTGLKMDDLVHPT